MYKILAKLGIHTENVRKLFSLSFVIFQIEVKLLDTYKVYQCVGCKIRVLKEICFQFFVPFFSKKKHNFIKTNHTFLKKNLLCFFGTSCVVSGSGYIWFREVDAYIGILYLQLFFSFCLENKQTCLLFTHIISYNQDHVLSCTVYTQYTVINVYMYF